LWYYNVAQPISTLTHFVSRRSVLRSGFVGGGAECAPAAGARQPEWPQRAGRGGWHEPENGGDATSGGRLGGRPLSGSGGSRDGARRGGSGRVFRKAMVGFIEEDAGRGRRESSPSSART